LRNHAISYPISLFTPAAVIASTRLKAVDMEALPVDLVAPNGKKWSQPTGLFINNEFVKASKGNTITSIDPA
jgi:hypothetical protein